jgi:hypothetical protein
MTLLIHISTKKDCCYDKNVIVSIADFLVEYLHFKWKSLIFCSKFLC